MNQPLRLLYVFKCCSSTDQSDTLWKKLTFTAGTCITFEPEPILNPLVESAKEKLNLVQQMEKIFQRDWSSSLSKYIWKRNSKRTEIKISILLLLQYLQLLHEIFISKGEIVLFIIFTTWCSKKEVFQRDWSSSV